MIYHLIPGFFMHQNHRMNTIQRVRSTENFTIIPNAVFKSGLSLRAIGLLTYILHLPDDWKLYKNYLYEAMPLDGKDAINTAWKQLEEKGFITKAFTTGGGRSNLPEIRYTVYDIPQTVAENPHAESKEDENYKVAGNPQQLIQEAGFPQPDFPLRKKGLLLSTNVLNSSPLTKVKGVPKKKLIKEKPPAKPKKEEPPPRPFWQAMVDTYMQFCETMFPGERPNFKRRQPKLFADLYDLLQNRAKFKKAEWSEKYAVEALKFYLGLAHKDDWLRKNFLLMHLVEQFDALFAREVAGKVPPAAAGPPKASEGFEAELKYYIGRQREGQLDSRLMTVELYDRLEARKYVELGFYESFPGNTREEQKRAAALAWIGHCAAKNKTA